MISDADKLNCLSLVFEHIYKPSNEKYRKMYNKLKRDGFNILNFNICYSNPNPRIFYGLNNQIITTIYKNKFNFKTPIMICNGYTSEFINGKELLRLNLEFVKWYNPKNLSFKYACKEFNDKIKDFYSSNCNFIKKNEKGKYVIRPYLTRSIDFTPIKIHDGCTILNKKFIRSFRYIDPYRLPMDGRENETIYQLNMFKNMLDEYFQEKTLVRCNFKINGCYGNHKYCDLDAVVTEIKILDILV